jgi:hypothetical protein
MEVHCLAIHLRVLDAFFFFVFLCHSFDTDGALINADDLFVTLFEHFLGQA